MPIKLSIKLDITVVVQSMMPELDKKTETIRQLQDYLETGRKKVSGTIIDNLILNC